jgi:trk system potassium uptake protein TrkH
LSCLNNIGPALGDIGPMGNFAGFSYFSKIILTLTMLIGRLEIMPMIIFLSPFAWKKH